jgi:hypothetical protein
MISTELAIRSVKILDIGVSTIVYFALALATVPILNKYIGHYNAEEEDKKSTKRIVLEICLRLWCIGVLSYVVRNVYPLIPWPFDGVYGYQHSRVKEVTSGVIYASYLATFDTTLQSKVGYLRTRLFGAVNSSHPNATNTISMISPYTFASSKN